MLYGWLVWCEELGEEVVFVDVLIVVGLLCDSVGMVVVVDW